MEKVECPNCKSIIKYIPTKCKECITTINCNCGNRIVIF